MACESAHLELVLILKMMGHKANYYNIGVTPGLCEVGVVEVEPISCGSRYRSNLGDAALPGSRCRDSFLQTVFLDSVEKKRIPEDHDSRSLRPSHFFGDFGERMNMDTVVIEGRSEDPCDDFEQEAGCYKDGKDLPLSVSRTGSR